MSLTLDDIVYVGFNNRVVALDKNTGVVVWDWKCPTGKGYVSLLLTDERHLIVSVSGYTYCLDPGDGHQLWFNELKGFGMGVASLAAWGASSAAHLSLAAAQEAAAAAARSASS